MWKTLATYGINYYINQKLAVFSPLPPPYTKEWGEINFQTNLICCYPVTKN